MQENAPNTKDAYPFDFRGMMPIMPTAISETGDLDETSQRRLVQYCLQCGAVAVGHFGLASEFFKISDDDRNRLMDIIVDEVAGRIPVFFGVTGPSNTIAVAYAREAEKRGADLVMLAPPYVRAPLAEELVEYYCQVSDAVSVPIILQDPGSAVLTAELLLRIFNEADRVIYIKAEGKSFIEKTAFLMNASGGQKPFVIGGAGGKHMIHMLRLGVTSFMTGTEALDLHASAVAAFLGGDEDQAADIYFSKILPYFAFYSEYPDELLKRMLYMRGVIDCPDVISPKGIAPMNPYAFEELKWVMERVGLTNRWPDIPAHQQ